MFVPGDICYVFPWPLACRTACRFICGEKSNTHTYGNPCSNCLSQVQHYNCRWREITCVFQIFSAKWRTLELNEVQILYFIS
jgi:hypothetical protein